MSDLDTRVRSGLVEVTARIRAAGGDPARVRICAVTKGFGPEAATAAVGAGLLDLGENYAQELVGKAEALAVEPEVRAAVRWHMIGTVQRNKVRLLAPHVALWQTVDRIELGAEVARRAPDAAVLVQVNATGEPAKGGCSPREATDLVHRLADLGLDVQGLMAIGPTAPDADPRPAFDAVAELAGRLGLQELSMGMSGDLDSAVAAGATMVRVGTALFGSRPPPVNGGDG